MTFVMEHLHPATKEIATMDAAERIRRLWGERWMGYPRAKVILNRLNDLLQRPPTHRTENLLLTGETNNGKSTIVREFFEQHKAVLTEGEEGIRADVVLLEAPSIPDEKRLYNNILIAVGAPVRTSDRVEKSELQVRRHLQAMGVRMLIIDEIHNMLRGNPAKQRIFLTVLKTLANQLQITLVAVGTEEAFSAIQTDPQLANRFKTAWLPRWQLNEEYLSLLDTFEYLLPLRHPSNLSEHSLALKILALSEGLFGEVHDVLCMAAQAAILNGQECITARLLSELDWSLPSERNRPKRDSY
jgi:PAS domain-containing protein